MNPTNKVQLTGNLGRDPEIKTFENGKLAKFSLATTEEYTTRGGDKTSNTHWHNIVAWGKVADHIEAEFKKGSFVSISGKLVSRSYNDKNGDKKYITEVVANEADIVQKQA